MKFKTTPECVTKLSMCEIFVFGSNYLCSSLYGCIIWLEL